MFALHVCCSCSDVFRYYVTCDVRTVPNPFKEVSQRHNEDFDLIYLPVNRCELVTGVSKTITQSLSACDLNLYYRSEDITHWFPVVSYIAVISWWNQLVVKNAVTSNKNRKRVFYEINKKKLKSLNKKSVVDKNVSENLESWNYNQNLPS